jgi:uncharacterized protein YozE (UPF0346 family)
MEQVLVYSYKQRTLPKQYKKYDYISHYLFIIIYPFLHIVSTHIPEMWVKN